MPKTTLHIVDGDSTGGTLRQAGFRKNGEILVWRDALYSGPVPAGLSLQQLSRVRSKFWTNGKTDGFSKRDAMLAGQGRYEHVVLWFGAKCILCQLSLLQILSWLRENGAAAKRLSWVSREGGVIPPEKMASAFASRRPITAAHMQIADRAWRAFRQSSPKGLVDLLRSDLVKAPGLKPVLTRLLQEYPDRRSGLSRLERLLLQEIRRHGGCKAVVAVVSVLAKETVGDTLLLDMLRNFVRAPHPLLELAEPSAGNFENHEFNRAVLRLTDKGTRVLAGRSDVIELNGIDRWIGGVHLLGHEVDWRWDRKAHSLVRAA